MPTVIGVILSGLLGLALLLVLVRLLRGPSAADRVVALDLLTTVMVGFLAIHAVLTGEAIYLDIALGIGLVAFLGTIGFGVLVERQADDEARAHPPPGDEPPTEDR